MPVLDKNQQRDDEQLEDEDDSDDDDYASLKRPSSRFKSAVTGQRVRTLPPARKTEVIHFFLVITCCPWLRGALGEVLLPQLRVRIDTSPQTETRKHAFAVDSPHCVCNFAKSLLCLH